MGHLFKHTFWRLTLSTRKRCHMNLWSAWLVLTHHHHHHLHFSHLHRHLELEKAIFSFLYVVLFNWRAVFCLFSVKPRAASQLSFLSKHVVRVAIYLVHWPSLWLPRLLSHWCGSWTVSWPLRLRLFASAELQLYRTSLPHQIISRTIWSKLTPSRWYPWLSAGCLLSAL
jgi:hypothetical protein